MFLIRIHRRVVASKIILAKENYREILWEFLGLMVCSNFVNFILLNWKDILLNWKGIFKN